MANWADGVKEVDKMGLNELERLTGIKEEDKVDCPHAGWNGACDTCKLGLSIETCEELYEQYLIERSCS